LGDAVVFLVVFLVTLALTPLFKQRAASWQLVDLPDTRKIHDGPVPLVGGLAMGIAFLAVFTATRPVGDPAQFLGVAAAIVLTLMGGALDDLRGLRATPKFAFQIFAALLLATFGGTVLTHFGSLVTENVLTLGRWSVPLTVIAIVGLMNAINMTDGLDGLAGSVALAACLGFGYAAGAAGDAAMFTVICLAAGAIVAFLVYNAGSPWRGPATVYMGDAGSLLIGLLLAWFSIRLAMSERPALAPMTAVWIVALPLADMGTIMVRRMLRGRSPFVGDREHVHHILLATGLSPQHATAALFIASLALAVFGIAAEHAGVPSYVMFYLFVGSLFFYGAAAEALCRRLGMRKPR